MAFIPPSSDLLPGKTRRRSIAIARPVSMMIRRALCGSSKGLVRLDPVDSMLDRLDSACAQKAEAGAA